MMGIIFLDLRLMFGALPIGISLFDLFTSVYRWRYRCVVVIVDNNWFPLALCNALQQGVIGVAWLHV